MSEGWATLSWVFMLLLSVFISYSGTGSSWGLPKQPTPWLRFASSELASTEDICWVGQSKALSHGRWVATSAPSPRVFWAALQAEPRLERNLGKCMPTLGSTSGNAEGQL